MNKDPNEEKAEIYFELGDCSLSQYMNSRIEKINSLNIDFANNIVYILKSMILFVLDFEEKIDYFHCDLKPDNVSLEEKSHSNAPQYYLKIIDLGGSTKAIDGESTCRGMTTPFYYTSPFRKDRKIVGRI